MTHAERTITFREREFKAKSIALLIADKQRA